MYLSDNELAAAIRNGTLICIPAPTKFDSNSFDVHLGSLKEARIWDIEKFAKHEEEAGRSRAELRIAKYQLGKFGGRYLCEPPPYDEDDETQLVGLRGDQVIVKPHGFLLWQTREEVGTTKGAEFICFINGKSTKARTGVLVHCTAPTINAGWHGLVVLEIANLGPFDIVLREDDVIAQVMVAQISSPPSKDVKLDSATYAQTGVDGQAD
jgi:dCTP deaminase